jgi:zinc transport system substrate-binding protein
MLAGLALLGVLLTEGCSDKGNQPASAQAGGKLDVVATIFPIASAVEEIGGDDVHVHTLLPAGRSPHEFTLKPSQAAMLGQARILVIVGLGIDSWAAKAVESAGGRNLRVVMLGEDPEFMAQGHLAPVGEHPEHTQPATQQTPPGPGDMDLAAEGHEHEHGHGGADPHVWLDPVFMQVFAQRIEQELSQADPAHAQGYRDRAGRFIQQLRQLDAQYRQGLSSLPNKYLVTYHNAFGYIARRYGLEQVSLYDVQAGGFGSARLDAVTDFIRLHDVQVLFVEPQFPADKLQGIAQRSHLRLAVLDDLGSPDRPGYTSYLELMRTNLQTLMENLKD